MHLWIKSWVETSKRSAKTGTWTFATIDKVIDECSAKPGHRNLPSSVQTQPSSSSRTERNSYGSHSFKIRVRWKHSDCSYFISLLMIVELAFYPYVVSPIWMKWMHADLSLTALKAAYRELTNKIKYYCNRRSRGDDLIPPKQSGKGAWCNFLDNLFHPKSTTSQQCLSVIGWCV